VDESSKEGTLIQITAGVAHGPSIAQLLTITSTSDGSKQGAVGFVLR
jgi:hypothetical protein